MNPTRREEYQVGECLRLGSYAGPEGRLYSNREIAEKFLAATIASMRTRDRIIQIAQTAQRQCMAGCLAPGSRRDPSHPVV
jgi:hypothetical protein